MENWKEIDFTRFFMSLDEFCSSHSLCDAKLYSLEMSIAQGIDLILERGKAFLVGEQGSAIATGLISERDLVRAIYKGQGNTEQPIQTLLAPSFYKLPQGSRVLDGMRFLKAHSFRHLVYSSAEGDRVLSIRDLLLFFMEQFAEELEGHQVSECEKERLLFIQDEDFSLSDEERDPSKFRGCLFLNTLSRLLTRVPLKFNPDEPLQTAVKAMQEQHYEAALILDFGTILKGIVSEKDVLKAWKTWGDECFSMPLKKLMTPGPKVLSHRHNLAHGMNFMSQGGFRQVIVVDEEHIPLGYVSLLDILGFISRSLPSEQGPVSE
jgi:CBS domain-containing protein